jgi:hypothetical protein
MQHKIIFLPDAHELAHIFEQIQNLEGEHKFEVFTNLAKRVIEHSDSIYQMFEMGLIDE